MKFHRPLGALLAVVCLLQPSLSRASQTLPLPEPSLHSDEIIIAQFVPPNPPQDVSCALLLQSRSDRIGAIKAYRACRSERALQQLAARRWQEAGIEIPR